MYYNTNKYILNAHIDSVRVSWPSLINPVLLLVNQRNWDGNDCVRVIYTAGFGEGILSACCGGGGPYNYNSSALCGAPGTKVCSDPSLYWNWDGVHLTEAASRWIANGLIQGPFAAPPIHSACPFLAQTRHPNYELWSEYI